MPIARWRLPQPQGDQFRLGRCVEQLRRGRHRPLLAHQGGFKAFLDELSPHILHGPNATAHGLADLLIFSSFQPGPSRSALSKITALRSFSDLPFSFLTVASQTARSSSVSRTRYFLFMGTSLWLPKFRKTTVLATPKFRLDGSIAVTFQIGIDGIRHSMVEFTGSLSDPQRQTPCVHLSRCGGRGPSRLRIDGIGSLSELLVGIGLSFPVAHFIRLSQGAIETASLVQASTGESTETPGHLSNRGNASGVR
jgi:hypothetical protein